MRRRGILMVVVMAVATCAAGVAFATKPADVSGSWTMTVTTPRGERTSTLVFAQDGEKLTVTSTTERGESSGAGTLAGNAIEWSITRETPRGTMTWTYKGTVEGDAMSGTVDMRGEAIPWKAARAK